MMSLENKIAGALFGVAVADALGAPLEFMSEQEIRRQHGVVKEMIGGGWLNVKPGEVTDDTQMTVAVASAIAAHPDDPIPYVGQNFAQWAMGGPKDIGITCRSAVMNALQAMRGRGQTELKDCAGLAEYELWAQAAQTTAKQNGNRSAGNGALMRTVYPGLYYADQEQALDIADKIGRLTHWDDLSAEACALYTKIIYCLVKHHAETVPKLMGMIEDILDGTRYAVKEKNEKIEPSGFVVNSFHCALHSIRSTKSFEDAIVTAVNMGGDADTIGAIAGGLAGALYGYEEIPVRWKTTLDQDIKNTLYSLSDDAVKNRMEK